LALALTASSLCTSACVNFTERADAAYLRGDWVTAAADYERALASESDPNEIARLNNHLAESRAKAGAKYLADARNLAGIGDNARALQSAGRAFQYMPSEEVQALVRDLRTKEGARLLEDGRVAVAQERWAEAV